MGDREEGGLAGPVRSVRTEVRQFVREGGRLIERPWYRSAIEYDANGRVVAQVIHNPNGTVARTVHEYDADGRLRETRSESDGVAAGRTVYLYDSLGRLTYELSLRADGSEGRQTRRVYDDDGSYTEEFTVEADAGSGAFVPAGGREDAAFVDRASFIRARRDPAGRPIEMRFYDASGGLLYRFVYHYNAGGRLTDMEQRTGDTALFELPPETAEGAALRREMAALFSPDAALSTVRYRYDADGRRIEAATWMGAHCIDRRSFAYDERGAKAAEGRYGPDGRLQSETLYEREYDARGNWVREAVRVRMGEEAEPQPSSLTQRVISYGD